MTAAPNPFALNCARAIKNPLLRGLAMPCERWIERASALKVLGTLYEEARGSSDFLERALEALKVSYTVNEEALARIPSSGPVVVVANHPFGGIEGVILAHLIRRRRPDAKLLANFLLGRVEEMREHLILVDPFGSSRASRSNRQPMREALEWIHGGGVLGIFPSGTVSHLQLSKRKITDPDWSVHVARLVRKTGAPVIPIFFEGTNGLLFQLMGLVHPLLRTAMLPRELCNRRNTSIAVKIGNAVASDKIRQFKTDEELIAYLRLRTYILGNSRGADDRHIPQVLCKSRVLEPLVDPVDPALMAAEIAKLPPAQLLDQSGEYLVAYGRAPQIPSVLREIGRLRELSFREVHEGTGKSIDLDRFDNYYTHLFVWNTAKQEVVGAYRLVRTDRVLRNFGISGLYTSTLFAYRPQLLKQMGPAIELGRSFVRPEYQRNYNSLHMLWRGIGLYVARHPRYRVLFGTVSISAEYDSVSKQLITSFLRQNNYIPELAKLIRARNPVPPISLRGIDPESTSFVVKDIQGVSELIREVEASNKGLPVLLKQYLRLGGKLLGFNIDENFGNVLDGLIYVDLSETDPRILERYLGKEGAQQFLDLHSPASGKKTGTLG